MHEPHPVSSPSTGSVMAINFHRFKARNWGAVNEMPGFTLRRALRLRYARRGFLDVHGQG